MKFSITDFVKIIFLNSLIPMKNKFHLAICWIYVHFTLNIPAC